MTDQINTEIDETTALLIRARALLERGWCRGFLARDANKREIWPTEKEAVAWCAYGALIAAEGSLPPWALSNALKR
jgi:hypothetical protein